LQGLCALIAIAIVHSDNRLTCAIAVALFATGIALSSLLIAAYSRPFTGEISVKPELLQEVVPSETAASHTTPGSDSCRRLTASMKAECPLLALNGATGKPITDHFAGGADRRHAHAFVDQGDLTEVVGRLHGGAPCLQ